MADLTDEQVAIYQGMMALGWADETTDPRDLERMEGPFLKTFHGAAWLLRYRIRRLLQKCIEKCTEEFHG